MEQWHQRLERMRKARGWSQATAAKQFCMASSMHTEDQVESVRRQIVRWERGDIPDPKPETRAAIARMFDLPERDFFADRPLSGQAMPPRLAPDTWAELMAEVRESGTPPAYLEHTAGELDRLATAYASAPAGEVLAETEDLGRVLVAMRGSLDLRGMQEQYRQLAWLGLLRACLLWDRGDEVAANRARMQAIALGHELGDGVVDAWGHEITAWISLTQGDYPRVVSAARAGIAAAPRSDVAAQLHAQAAKAYARLGDRHKTEVELEAVRVILDEVPLPENLRNHFAVDPTKATFYAMDAYRVAGDDAMADAMADTVIATSQGMTDELISPMRLSEAELTKATVHARGGDIDGAVGWVDQALSRDRQSIPSLAMVAQEVSRTIAGINPKRGRELEHHLAALTR